MPRKERPLDQGDDRLLEFAADLRALRDRCGGLPYRELGRRAHFSAAALCDAAGGRRLPSLAVTKAYVRACGGPVAVWEQRWHRLAATTAGTADARTAVHRTGRPSRPAGSWPADRQPTDLRPTDLRPANPGPAGSPPTGSWPTHPVPGHSRPAGSWPAGSRPADSRPGDPRFDDPRPGDARSGEPWPAELRLPPFAERLLVQVGALLVRLGGALLTAARDSTPTGSR